MGQELVALGWDDRELPLLEPLAARDIDNRRQHLGAFVGFDRIEADLDWEFAAVLPEDAETDSVLPKKLRMLLAGTEGPGKLAPEPQVVLGELSIAGERGLQTSPQ